MLLKKIKDLCKTKGVSVAAVEIATGLGNGVIGKWGESSPRADNLKRVADYFGVTIDDLLSEE